jgi:hypothetical protein
MALIWDNLLTVAVDYVVNTEDYRESLILHIE